MQPINSINPNRFVNGLKKINHKRLFMQLAGTVAIIGASYGVGYMSGTKQSKDELVLTQQKNIELQSKYNNARKTITEVANIANNALNEQLNTEKEIVEAAKKEKNTRLLMQRGIDDALKLSNSTWSWFGLNNYKATTEDIAKRLEDVNSHSKVKNYNYDEKLNKSAQNIQQAKEEIKNKTSNFQNN